jgi:hypothetical protein
MIFLEWREPTKGKKKERDDSGGDNAGGCQRFTQRTLLKVRILMVLCEIRFTHH